MRSLCLIERIQHWAPVNFLTMLVSAGTYHPVAIGYSASKKSRKLERLKSRDSPTNKRASVRSESVSCQVQLIMALQGIETDARARHLVASTVANLDNEQKSELIRFLNEVEIPAAMEHNACKAFSCTTNALESAINEESIDSLAALWKLIHTQVIPTLEAMLYPLKAFDSAFNVRKLILTCFRDRVLVRVLSNVRCTLPTLQSMIFYISFVTADNSAECLKFNELADRVLGLKKEKHETEDEFDDTNEGCRFIRPKTKVRPRLSEPTNLYASSRIPISKKRSRTLPTRSVHWADLPVSSLESSRKISLE